jgi:hypothetical protein
LANLIIPPENTARYRIILAKLRFLYCAESPSAGGAQKIAIPGSEIG